MSFEMGVCVRCDFGQPVCSLSWLCSCIFGEFPWYVLLWTLLGLGWWLVSEKYGTISLFACHPCTGAMLSSLYHSNFSICAAEASTSKCLLISWLQSPSAVILEPKKIKSVILLCHCVPMYFL